MTNLEVYRNLCVYDKRNPDYITVDDDDYTEPRKDCFCDNCFYNRDVLALEILGYRHIFNER